MARIALLVDHDANRRLLGEWIEAHGQHEVVTARDERECEAVDLFLVDDAGFRRVRSLVVEAKADAGDVFLPCLLVSERGPAAIDGEGAAVVDDVVGLPVAQGVLERRFDQLLRIREQSRRIDADRRTIEQQNERLRTFAARLAHDLRNPLSIATGYLEEARESGARDHFDAVESALGRMQRLVEETLTLAKVGQAALDREPVSLRAVAERAWRHVETEDGTLTVEDDARLDADGGRLEALFENCFRNAVEHGSTNPPSQAREDASRHVAVAVGVLDDRDGFYVADDGPGIDEHDREQVFEVGYTTREDGTGFGLRIVREIAEAHGWSVRVTGADDGGARFEVTGVDLRPESG